MEFTDDELELIQDALAVKFCLVESGQAHISYDDMMRMGEETRKHMGCRMPSRDQLEAARQYRDLWTRLLQRRR